MKNWKAVILSTITAALLFQACGQNNSIETDPFSLPKVPLQFELGENYLQSNLSDTLYRADSLGQRIFISIRRLDSKMAKLWRIDTMHFNFKNQFSMWDTQKRGYYWTFQDISISTDRTRDTDGRETEIYERLDQHFVFHPVRQPETGQTYPAVDYKIIDEYWSSIHAVAIGVANPTDGDLFVMAYPVLKKLRGADQYRKRLQGDSIPVPSYYDQPDTTRMVCLRISLLQLNN